MQALPPASNCPATKERIALKAPTVDRNPHQAPRWQGGLVYERGEPHNPYEIRASDNLLGVCWCAHTTLEVPRHIIYAASTLPCGRPNCERPQP